MPLVTIIFAFRDPTNANYEFYNYTSFASRAPGLRRPVGHLSWVMFGKLSLSLLQLRTSGGSCTQWVTEAWSLKLGHWSWRPSTNNSSWLCMLIVLYVVIHKQLTSNNRTAWYTPNSDWQHIQNNHHTLSRGFVSCGKQPPAEQVMRHSVTFMKECICQR